MTTDKSKILAEYIKKGWKLTDVECPQCGSPLLKKDDRYFCAICNQEVYVVESHGEALSILEKDVKDKIRKRIIEELNLLASSGPTPLTFINSFGEASATFFIFLK